jgi:hypothetical protein
MNCRAPARFNQVEGKWNPTDGANPHEYPRNENFLRIRMQNGGRRFRRIPRFSPRIPAGYHQENPVKAIHPFNVSPANEASLL